MRNLTLLIALLISFVSFGKGVSHAYAEMRKVYEEGTTLEGKEAALQFLDQAKEEGDPYYIAKTYYILAYLCSYSEDFGNSVIYYLEGARFAELSHNELLKSDLISMYKNLGIIMGDYSNYALAHRFINKGIEIATSLGDHNQIQSLLNNRIHELLEEEKYAEALHQIDSFNLLFGSENARYLKMKNMAGIAHQNLGAVEKAMSSYTFVLSNGRKEDPETYSRSLQNMGSIYFDQQAYEKALSYFREQEFVTKESGLNQLLFQAHEFAGETYLLMQQYQKAIDQFHEAIALDGKGDLKPDGYTVYGKLSQAYEQTGDVRKALYYKDVYARKMEIFIAEQKRIEELDKKYNIQLLTERYFDMLAANEKQQETEKIARIGMGATVIVFLLIIFNIYYRQYRVKRSIREELKKIALLDI